MTTEYKMAEAAAQERLAEFKSDDPADLSRELALCRLLLEQATAAKNTGLSASLLTILGRLSREFDAQQARRHLFLHRDVLARVATEIVKLVAEEFQAAGLENWEDRLDALCAKLGLAVEGAANTKREVQLLIGRRE